MSPFLYRLLLMPLLGVCLTASGAPLDEPLKPLPAVPPLPTDGYVPPSRADFFIRGQMEGQPAPASSTIVTAQPEPRHE